MSKTQAPLQFIWRRVFLAFAVLVLIGSGVAIVTDFADGGPLRQRCRIAPGANLADHPDDFPWQDITPDLHWPAPVAVTVGSEDEQPENFSNMTLTLRNSVSKVPGVEGMQGRYTTDNPLSDLWPDFEQNTPIEHAISTDDGSSYDITARMFVTAALDDVGKTDKLALTRITAHGLFTRMGQWEDLASAAQRSMLGVRPGDYVPYAYWPLEDGSAATQFTSAIAGQQDGFMRTLDGYPDPGSVTPSANSVARGSKPLPTIGAGAAITMPVTTYTDTGQWSAQVGVVLPTVDTSWFGQLSMSSGYVALIQIEPTLDEFIVNIASIETGVVVASNIETVDRSLLVGKAVSVVGTAIDTGGGDEFEARLFDTEGNILVTNTISNPATYGTITRGSLVSFGPDDLASGHFTVFIDPVFDPATDGVEGARALGGWTGETPAERAERICFELSLQFEAIDGGVPEAGAVFEMGPQATGRALDILRDCERVGRGVLDDHLGLVQYYTLSSAYNQAPILVVDGSQKELFLPYAPVMDDLGRANQVTASQPAGSSSVAFRNEEDVYGVPGVRPARGLYPKGIEVNIDDAELLIQHAGFETARGTLLGKRYPQITLDGLRKPAQGLAMLAGVGLRAKIRVTNPPTQQRQADVDVLIKGWAMTVAGPRRGWLWQCNTVRSDAYEVGVYDDGVTRYDSFTSKLIAAVDADDTAWKMVESGAPADFITTATHPTRFPVNLDVGGLTYECTAITKSAATFVAAGAAIHGVNASLTPGLPAGLAAGDLLLFFAAIRNSGTGTVDTPAGWTALLTSGNIALFGKYAAAGEFDPTVTFSGGVAGADTSAQLAAFRNCGIAVHDSNAQLNGSAQDIATPIAGINRAGCVVIWLGWKQDDWTSVAVVAGGTEIGEPDTTAGDDQGIVWDYLIQTTATTQAASSFVVTGGAAAISRGAVVVLEGGAYDLTVARLGAGNDKAHDALAPIHVTDRRRYSL